MGPSDHWCRLGTITEVAMALEAEMRTDYLDRVCGPDTSLRRQVEKLLAADRQAGRFLEVSAVDRLARPHFIPTEAELPPWIGSYRTLRRLGSGGIGDVFLAHRIDEAEALQVAIKVLRQLPDDVEARGGLLAERDILARLEHPNIVRLFESGITADRRPYLVMEYVDGLPVDIYCRRHRLSLEQRLTLFEQLCAAIHFAHQRQVVHRDLKPSNILVRADDRLKLLDFSIAKVISSRPELRRTGVGNRPMTLSYASPEQIRGEPVTAATDVHGLGIVLYCLLTEQHPFPVEGQSLYRAAEIICNHAPLAPSRAASRHPLERAHGSAPALRWAHHLADALDIIVLKALEKRPCDRYASVKQLTADLRRWQRETRPQRCVEPPIRKRESVSGEALEPSKRRQVSMDEMHRHRAFTDR